MGRPRKEIDPFSRKVSPMLATLLKEPFDDLEFVHEVKWDGYRIMAFVQKGKVRLDSRSGLDYTRKYQPMAAALKDLNHDAIIDCEVVELNEERVTRLRRATKKSLFRSPGLLCV